MLAIPIGSGLLAACTSRQAPGSASETQTEESPEENATLTPELEGDYADAEYGGRLSIALIDAAPTFDIHQTTTSTTAFVAWHIFEALFTWDAEMRPIPELPEEYEVSDDGLVHSFRLRDEVMFHDGAPLTSRDVVASIERWGSIVGLGESLMDVVDEFVVEDDHRFEIRLTEPFGTLPIALARQNQGCAIYPEWAIEEAGEDELQSFVGTGPYRLVENVPDQYVLLERFEVYTPAPGEVDGYGGQKHRFLDQLMFIPVTDEAARVSGLQSGEYHYLESISPDQLPTIESDSDTVVEDGPACCYPNLVINTRSPIMEDQHIRRAVQLALDHQPILQAGYGEDFYRLDPSLLMRETPWHTLAGEEYYNVHDVERARRLLEEAGYDGEPVRFMVTQAYRDLYNSSIVIARQLEEAGFSVDVLQYDWATLSDLRNEEDEWELYLTLATFRPDPIMRNLTCSAPGWWCDEEKDELLSLIQTEGDPDTRYEHWEQVQRLFYEQVPRIKVGDTFPILVRSRHLKGFPQVNQLQPAFWNSWLDDD